MLGNGERLGEGHLQSSNLEEHSGNQKLTSNLCAALEASRLGAFTVSAIYFMRFLMEHPQLHNP